MIGGCYIIYVKLLRGWCDAMVSSSDSHQARDLWRSRPISIFWVWAIAPTQWSVLFVSLAIKQVQTATPILSIASISIITVFALPKGNQSKKLASFPDLANPPGKSKLINLPAHRRPFPLLALFWPTLHHWLLSPPSRHAEQQRSTSVSDQITSAELIILRMFPLSLIVCIRVCYRCLCSCSCSYLLFLPLPLPISLLSLCTTPLIPRSPPHITSLLYRTGWNLAFAFLPASQIFSRLLLFLTLDSPQIFFSLEPA